MHTAFHMPSITPESLVDVSEVHQVWERMPIVVSMDDDYQLLCLYWQTFGAYGFRCIPCNCLTEIFSALESLPVSLITVDLDMGETNGVTVARAIRNRGLAVPLLLLSGSIASVAPGDLKLFSDTHEKGQGTELLLQKMSALTATRASSRAKPV